MYLTAHVVCKLTMQAKNNCVESIQIPSGNSCANLMMQEPEKSCLPNNWASCIGLADSSVVTSC